MTVTLHENVLMTALIVILLCVGMRSCNEGSYIDRHPPLHQTPAENL